MLDLAALAVTALGLNSAADRKILTRLRDDGATGLAGDIDRCPRV